MPNLLLPLYLRLRALVVIAFGEAVCAALEEMLRPGDIGARCHVFTAVELLPARRGGPPTVPQLL